jgi:hypothetical protein
MVTAFDYKNHKKHKNKLWERFTLKAIHTITSTTCSLSLSHYTLHDSISTRLNTPKTAVRVTHVIYLKFEALFISHVVDQFQYRSISVPISLSADQSQYRSISVPINLSADQSQYRSISVPINLSTDQSECRSIPVPINLSTDQSLCRPISVPINLSADKSKCRSISVPINLSTDQSQYRSISVPHKLLFTNDSLDTIFRTQNYNLINRK